MALRRGAPRHQPGRLCGAGSYRGCLRRPGLDPAQGFHRHADRSGFPCGPGPLYASNPSSGISSFTIERSSDQVHFTALATLSALPDSLRYQYIDPSPLAGAVFYRLIWIDQRGRTRLFALIALTRPESTLAYDFSGYTKSRHGSIVPGTLLQEQGDRDDPYLRCPGAITGITTSVQPLSISTTSLTLPVVKLAAGTYFLVAETKDHHQVKGFIKKP